MCFLFLKFRGKGPEKMLKEIGEAHIVLSPNWRLLLVELLTQGITSMPTVPGSGETIGLDAKA